MEEQSKDFEGADSNVSEEEQAQYNMFVGMCFKLIYGKGSGDAIEQAISQADDVVEVLANTAAKTIVSVEKSALEAGKKLSDDVIFHGGTEVVQDLVDYAVQMKKIAPEQLEDMTNQVIYQTVRIYGDQALQEGLITEEEKQSAMTVMQEEMAAEATQNNEAPAAENPSGMLRSLS
jgi:hypothetical protein